MRGWRQIRGVGVMETGEGGVREGLSEEQWHLNKRPAGIEG